MQPIRRKSYPYKGVNGLGVINLLSNIGFAMVGTIWAIYLDSFLKNQSYVGFLSSLFTIVAIFSYFMIVPIMQRKSKTKLFTLSLLIYILSYTVFALFSNLYAVIILGLLVSFIGSLRITCFGIMVRDKSKNKDLVKNEGMVYTLFNLAWLFGPLIAGFVAEKYGLNLVFLGAAFLILISLFLFKSFKITDNRIIKKKNHNILKLFLRFFKKKERVVCYILSSGITFWWALIYIYIPLKIIESGLGDMILGVFLFAVAVPLVLSEYHFSKLSSKIGFKKLFLIAYFILMILSLICFFIGNIYFILVILVLASFGIAMIEPTTEAYFFDIITKNQRDQYYGPYNTAVDVGHYFGTFIPAILLLFLDFKFVFLLYALVMFSLLVLSLKIKNVIEDKR